MFYPGYNSGDKQTHKMIYLWKRGMNQRSRLCCMNRYGLVYGSRSAGWSARSGDVLSNINKPKERYKIKNWSAYNSGLKQRGSLTLWIDEKVSKNGYHTGESKRGGQMIYSADCIVLLLSLKVTFRLAFRQLEGFVWSLFSMAGIDLQVSSYTQIYRRQKGLKCRFELEKRCLRGASIR